MTSGWGGEGGGGQSHYLCPKANGVLYVALFLYDPQFNDISKMLHLQLCVLMLWNEVLTRESKNTASTWIHKSDYRRFRVLKVSCCIIKSLNNSHLRSRRVLPWHYWTRPFVGRALHFQGRVQSSGRSVLSLLENLDPEIASGEVHSPCTYHLTIPINILPHH